MTLPEQASGAGSSTATAASMLPRSSAKLRRLRLAATIGIVLLCLGCTASWNALVRYSELPAVEGMTPEMGVYAEVLRYFRASWGLPEVLLSNRPPQSDISTVFRSGHGVVPGHWADTLQLEVLTALADSSLAQLAPHPAIEQAAALARIPVREGTPADAIRPDQPNEPRIWFSRAGFNRDSTVAAINVQFWCGYLCGHGVTLLLARRPGNQWKVWHGFLHWIS